MSPDTAEARDVTLEDALEIPITKPTIQPQREIVDMRTKIKPQILHKVKLFTISNHLNFPVFYSELDANMYILENKLYHQPSRVYHHAKPIIARTYSWRARFDKTKKQTTHPHYIALDEVTKMLRTHCYVSKPQFWMRKKDASIYCKEAGVRVCHTKNIPILSRIWKAHR